MTVRPRRNPITRLVAAVGFAVLAAGCTSGVPGGGDPADEPIDPLLWRAPLWLETLGGEGVNPLTLPANVARLNDPASTDLPADVAASAAGAAEAWLTAEVTGAGRDRFAGYWPDGDGTVDGALTGAGCTGLDVVAVNPQPLPMPAGTVDGWVKVLVGWTADCPAADRTFPQVTFVYLRDDADGWVVVRPALVPRPEPVRVSGVAPDWALDPVAGCVDADRTVLARLEVAAAWAQLCADATAAAVPLVAVDGWRDAADQAARYADAVERYGAAEAARRIAAADGTTCTSAHCAGAAIDVRPDPAVLAWLTEPVLCADLAGGLTELTATDGTAAVCPADTRPVPRLARYGFVAPLPTSPGHLEWALPLPSLEPSGVAGACQPDPGAPVADIIAAVWRCRLTLAGWPSERIDETVHRALVVARCESGLDPGFLAFGGRFAGTAHPDTGRRYDAAGLFGLTRNWATALVGDDDAWWDPVAGAAAGAERFVEEWAWGRDPWGPFGCVAGDGIRPGGVLPEQGGPPLPDWATRY